MTTKEIDGVTTKTFTEEQFCNSPALQKLSVLSRLSPINTNNMAEVEEALAPALVFLIDAMDNEAIHFEDKASDGAFYQMMLVCLQLVVQIRPESSTVH